MQKVAELMPEAGLLQQLAHNFYRLCAPNPSVMTGPGTNTYIYGDTELAVFDAGPAIDAHADRILRVQEELDAPITSIFASHTHMDHSPCTQLIQKSLPQAKCIGIPSTPNQPYEDHTFKADIKPSDGDVIELKGGSVQAIYTPGHVENHLCWLIQEHGVLLTGDHLMSGSTVVIVPPKGNMSDYIASLEKLSDFNFSFMGPGHGPLITEPQELIHWTIKHRLQREAKVFSAVTDEPQPLDVIVKQAYDDVEEHLHEVACYSLHAHLLKLEAERKVRERELGWCLR